MAKARTFAVGDRVICNYKHPHDDGTPELKGAYAVVAAINTNGKTPLYELDFDFIPGPDGEHYAFPARVLIPSLETGE